MFSKIFIGVLVVFLIVMIGIFLYSNHQLSQPYLSTPPSSQSNNAQKTTPSETTASQKSTSKNDDVNAINSVAVQTPNEQQPDKALPIPAHQLKKIIADKPKNDALKKGLDEKIQAANQAIAAIDKAVEKQLPDNVSSSSPPEKKSTTTPDKTSAAIESRLDNIKNHLQKTQ
ncbi:MAG: hypothetical protein ACI8VC_001204 [Candidatus Endobugula sp.]|jgi:hypothetical protein